jgi:hypothetical protein
MSRFLGVGIAAIVVLGAASPGFAAILFDGTGDPTAAGFSINGSAAIYSFDTPAAGIMSQSGSGPGEWFVDGAPAAAELNSATGWVVEYSRDNIQFGGHGNHVRVQDDDGYIGMIHYASGIEIYNGANQYYATDGTISGAGFFPLSPGFHTIRLERAPGSSTATFTIDGGVNGSISTVDATLTSTFDLGGPRAGFGNIGAGAVADVQWDYFNVQAIPEPHSVTELGDVRLGPRRLATKARRVRLGQRPGRLRETSRRGLTGEPGRN